MRIFIIALVVAAVLAIAFAAVLSPNQTTVQQEFSTEGVRL